MKLLHSRSLPGVLASLGLLMANASPLAAQPKQFSGKASVFGKYYNRFDGNGYPDQLMGTDIPLAARLVTIADVYDALRSPRVYKTGLTHKETMEVMLAGFSTQFDPALLHPFQKAVSQFEQIYAEYSE